MQHLVVFFDHRLHDLVPWCEFIRELGPLLAESETGEFIGDDMAIDGGDCEAVFKGPDAKALLDFLLPRLQSLPFPNNPSTRIELVYGELESVAPRKSFALTT
ncbi:hypothetical protein J7E62_32070 [Variovorax paradoxus]|nr:hypothetical protein [Variovorax paradoxus]